MIEEWGRDGGGSSGGRYGDFGVLWLMMVRMMELIYVSLAGRQLLLERDLLCEGITEESKETSVASLFLIPDEHAFFLELYTFGALLA